MVIENKFYRGPEQIEYDQRRQIILQNTQNELWRRLKKEVAKQINIQPAIPVDNNLNILNYDATNGKRISLSFNLDNDKSTIPQFHIGGLVYSIAQKTIEETYEITNIAMLIDDNSFVELAEKYANWINEKLEANKN